MTRKVNPAEPPIPAGAKSFTNCSIEVLRLPLDVFMLVGDGRKGVLLCRNRRSVLAALASHADADGTHCYPSHASLERETGFSHGSLVAYLNNLEKLGFIVKGGYAWEDGPRVRRLVMPATPDASDSGGQDSRAGSQDSTQEVKAGSQDSQSRKSGFDSRKSGLKSRKTAIAVHNQPVPNQPETNQPANQPGGLVGRFSSIYGQESCPIPSGLGAKVKPALESLADRYGADVVMAAWQACLQGKNWGGLTKSTAAYWFLKEFESTWLTAAKERVEHDRSVEADRASAEQQFTEQRAQREAEWRRQQAEVEYAMAHVSQWL